MSALDALAQAWWYYTVELAPGLFSKGQADEMPLLARMALREIDIKGALCLDMGTMEGLMPVLMVKGGAVGVMAIDALDHCVEKMTALKSAHGVNFEYASVGTMYDLDKKMADPPGQQYGFDLINCSGLLYHVWNPMGLLAGVRPLLRRNGLMIVSTNVILEEEPVMAFNVAGRMQAETNTFWYFSPSCLDYVLRYLRLEPIKVLYLRHDAMGTHNRFRNGTHGGDISIICRATDHSAADPWMAASAQQSWEYQWLVDWARADAQPLSSIRAPRCTESVDVAAEVFSGRAIPPRIEPTDTHRLRLEDNG